MGDDVAVRRPPLFTSLQGYQRSWASADLAAGLTLLVIAVPEQLATSRLAGMPPITGFYAFVAGTRALRPPGLQPADVGRGRLDDRAAVRRRRGRPRPDGIAALRRPGGDPGRHGRAHRDAGRPSCGSGGSPSSSRPPSSPASCPASPSSSSPTSCPISSGCPRRRARTSTGWPTCSPTSTRSTGGRSPSASGSWPSCSSARRVDRRIPAALIGLVVSTALVGALDLQAHGVAVLGPVKTGAPHFGLTGLSWSTLRSLAPLAAVVALVVVTQTAATTRAFAERGRLRRRRRARLPRASAPAAWWPGSSGSFPVNASPPRTGAVATAGGRTQAGALGRRRRRRRPHPVRGRAEGRAAGHAGRHPHLRRAAALQRAATWSPSPASTASSSRWRR